MLSHSQNFINNKELVAKLLHFVNFNDADLVLEIGPGKGIITEELVKMAKNVIAVEADKKLFDSLKIRFINTRNIQLLNRDFLEYKLPTEPFMVVSNIPFNITADVVRKITDENSRVCAAYLVMQKEAAEKFVGAPHAHSPLLSHFLNINFEIKKLTDISRANYSPKPKFDTAFISIVRRISPIFDLQKSRQFRDFLVYVFERYKPHIKEALKSIMSNLQVKIILNSLNIAEGTEVKEIMFNDWVSIFGTFMKHAPEKSKKIIFGSYKKLLLEQSKLKKINRTRKDKN